MTQAQTTQESAADEIRNFTEYHAVEKALQPYIDSAKTGDGTLSRTAFYDHARIVGSVQGEIYVMTADEFEGAVTEAGPAPDVQSRIASIEISGPAATARVEFLNWGEFRFTDFFVLYKRDGEWKISSKVYDSHAKN